MAHKAVEMKRSERSDAEIQLSKQVVQTFLNQYGKVGAQLQGDLDRIGKRNIPVDIVLKQRREVLGA